MKKLITILVALVFPLAANASFELFDSGTKIGHFTKLNCGTNFTCSSVSGKGQIALTTQPIGVMQNLVTTSGDLSVSECGSTVTSTLQHATFTLPSISSDSALGCKFTFIVMKELALSGEGIYVDVENAQEKILGLTNSAGDSISADNAGDAVVLEAISDSATDGYLWAPSSVYGTWTDSN